MIKAVHLDDRLIHGQVAISWTRGLGIDVLLVVNDDIVKDPMRKNALKLGVPAGVKYGFRSVEEGIQFLNSEEQEKYKIMVLVDNPIDAMKVCLQVKGISRLTIGGVRKKAPMVMDNLNLTDKDREALQSIMDKHMEVGVMPTPNHKFVDLKDVLNK